MIRKRFEPEKIFLSILIIVVSMGCLSCNMKAKKQPIAGQLELVDALISQNQYKDALKALKETERITYDSWSFIGLYRRYIQLGEKDLAEKILLRGLKKNPSNPELSAVISNYMLRSGRTEEAYRYAEKLSGTRYGSIYSEAALRKAVKNSGSSGLNSFFSEAELYRIYQDAYTGTGNNLWLRNCAIFNLAAGNFGNAAEISPKNFSDADDAYFWALVLYDSGKFYDSIATAETALRLLYNYDDKTSFSTSELKLLALESDAYLSVSDSDNAENKRQLAFNTIYSPNEEDEDTNKILPVLVHNSVVFARNRGNSERAAELIFFEVNRWPEFVPGLILYADFAVEELNTKEEDIETLALKKAGIESLEMEKFNRIRKIPISDAAYRISAELKRKRDPYLEIILLDLNYRMDKTVTVKSKTADLWKLLESNYSEKEKYPELLVQYAVSFLIRTKQYEDAETLFYRYISDINAFDGEKDFWQQFEQILPELALPFAEEGGWFAAHAELGETATRIYEHCAFGEENAENERKVSPYLTTGAGMNLADIYFTSGQREKALDLYGKLAGREIRDSLRSDIFFRIAKIYADTGDERNAARAADYAVSIYPDNVRAQLLLSKMNAK